MKKKLVGLAVIGAGVAVWQYFTPSPQRHPFVSMSSSYAPCFPELAVQAQRENNPRGAYALSSGRYLYVRSSPTDKVNEYLTVLYANYTRVYTPDDGYTNIHGFFQPPSEVCVRIVEPSVAGIENQANWVRISTQILSRDARSGLNGLVNIIGYVRADELQAAQNFPLTPSREELPLPQPPSPPRGALPVVPPQAAPPIAPQQPVIRRTEKSVPSDGRHFVMSNIKLTHG